MDLQAAANGLAESSRLLSESIGFGVDDLIEVRFALVRAAKSKFYGAMAAYIEHQQKPVYPN